MRPAPVNHPHATGPTLPERRCSLRLRIAFPDCEGVVLGVKADGEVPEGRHGRLRNDDFPAKVLDLGGVLIDRRDANIVGDGVLWMLPGNHPAVDGLLALPVGRGYHPVLHRPGGLLDLPAEQLGVEASCPVAAIGGDSRMNTWA